MLWALISDYQREHPTEYDRVWVPYMSGFPHHLEHGLVELSLDEFEAALPRHPQVRFDVYVGETLTSSQERKLVDPWILPSIATLKFRHTRLTSNFLATFAESLDIAKLASVSLIQCKSSSLATLFRSEHAASLGTLHLWSATIDAEEVNALLRGDGVQHIATLGLSHATLDVDTIEALLGAPQCDGITHLNLSDTSVHDKCLTTLSRCQQLEHLDLSHTHITDAVFDVVSELSSLASLVLVGTRIRCTKRLGTSPKLTNLRRLELSWTPANKEELLSGIANSEELDPSIVDYYRHVYTDVME